MTKREKEQRNYNSSSIDDHQFMSQVFNQVRHQALEEFDQVRQQSLEQIERWAEREREG